MVKFDAGILVGEFVMLLQGELRVELVGAALERFKAGIIKDIEEKKKQFAVRINVEQILKETENSFNLEFKERRREGR